MKSHDLLTTLGVFASTSLLAACSSSNAEHDDKPKSAPAPTDACNGAPVDGRCVDAKTVESCGIPSEGGKPRPQVTKCSDDEECRVDDKDVADCVLKVGCRTGDTACKGTGTLRTCKDGVWVDSPCSTTCVNTPIASTCRSSGITLVARKGRATFQRRKGNASRTALEATPVEAPARGFLLTFQRGTEVISATTTSADDGSFTLDVPTTLEAGDVVRLAAVAGDDAGGIAYLVANPGFPAGRQKVDALDDVYRDGTKPPAVWSWDWTAKDLPHGNVDLQIPLTISGIRHAGGIANVFDQVGASYRETKRRYGKGGAPLVVWMGDSVAWDCGDCQQDQKRLLFANRFQHDLLISATDDQTYFSDAMLQHEFGHYVMATYGKSNPESGNHDGSCPSYPGQAWSEGFASWFSMYALGSSVYSYFEKDGALICDYEGYTVNGEPWPRPTPSAKDVSPSSAPGLLQTITETEVTATLLKLSRGSADPGPILKALASPRMTKTVALPGGRRGYERSYFAHQWNQDDGTVCQAKSPPEVLLNPAQTMADLFDAMLCAGFDKARLDAATEPATHYPFPSSSPLCRPR
ncbi:hypothetical protein LVJ94_03560 [Pendulispora rubella]|uniref:Lipoprotein n=1 Tax=Pendulispora rubella TaxID=2741070 RepID=A0ABZ2L5V5_9BACT